jgi:pimeloyl-ACP methyl ester carboxylesterase
VAEFDLELSDGRTLHAYDSSGDHGPDELVVFWHHGTPNIGAPPEPLFAAAERLGIRWVSYDRPGYGGSTPLPGRDVASAAADVSRIADALGIEQFAAMGHSSGGAHALACAALMPDRVLAVVSVSGMAPYTAEGLDWFAGMAPAGVASLSAAVQGRSAKESYEASATEDDPGFIPADIAALNGEWSWFIKVVRPALEGGPGAGIDDDLADVGAWGFDPSDVVAPVLFLHGGKDRMVPSTHSEWLARHCPSAELRLCPDDGHISVLGSADGALEWLAAHRRQG